LLPSAQAKGPKLILHHSDFLRNWLSHLLQKD
jgi:hypothetical protein